jgi:pyridoxal phosphate enzyme (YggS family)
LEFVFNLCEKVRLVAVSKTKSVEAVMEAYNAGQRHFGENYVQEIISKAEFLPSDIKWHFIGHLQSNKCKSIIAIPNLFVVETVDSEKLASKLNSLCKESDRVLNVMVQVNTSAELSKSGVDPGKECVALAQFIHTNCKNLNLLGLMTIGSFSDEPSRECFDVLQKCRAEVASELNCAPETLELSMGMSNDFELAVLGNFLLLTSY